MIWMCGKPGLPAPDFRPVPDVTGIEIELDEYVEHLLDVWQLSLAQVEPKRFWETTYESPWKVEYCIDAMLEHAVMHPTRHRFQLEELQRAL